MTDYRKAYGLPDRYFLSLGRMVEKKNLATLVSAYARYAEGVTVAGEKLKVKGNDGEKHGAGSGEHGVRESTDTRHTPVALVFVGSGELESVLGEQARGLGLRVIDRSDWKAGLSGHSRATRDGVRRSRGQIDKEPCEDFNHGLGKINEDKSERLAADRTGGDASCRVTPAVGHCPIEQTDDSAAQRGAVYFYGFRQIEENPVFYALAEAFVLPSFKEEWGLVVNEAMACSLPVIVSRTAGCAEDLLPGGESVQCSVGSVLSGENAALNPQLSTLNSLEERSNGFVFDPTSSDALSEALRRIAVAGEKLKVRGGKQGAGSGDQGVRETADGEDAAAILQAEMGRRSREIVAKFSCENFARQALSAARAALPA